MKANPGGTVEGSAILGREKEITEIWGYLENRSVLLTSERRVGKTSIMRKMLENPRNGWIPVLCFVESASHPVECVKAIYHEAEGLGVWPRREALKSRFLEYWNVFSKAQIGEWKLPEIQREWKQLLDSFFEIVVENTDARLLVMLDEFPHTIDKMAGSGKEGEKLAMEFLDVLRALRQQWGGSGRIRLILSGSIGLHLVVKRLRESSGYKGKPTNDMKVVTISGMTEEETALMCRAYLEDEGIVREPQDEFDRHMYERTEGLPLYIQHICERFQKEKRPTATPADIDAVLNEMMNDVEIEWFRDAEERIRDYYSKLESDRIAYFILDELSRHEKAVLEKDIIEHVKSQTPVEYDRDVIEVLELLRQDHYIRRDIAAGWRRYRFTYRLMREWWKINRGRDE